MRLLALLIILICATPAHAESGFLPEIDDIPVPEGFSVSDENPLVYDTPGGRIVQTTIEGTGDEAVLKQFYLDSLPQLGWQRDEKGRDTEALESVTLSFAKEDEKVDMTFQEDGAKLQVKFSLYPVE